MERIHISLPEKQLDRIDELIENGHYENRSEYFREKTRNDDKIGVLA